MLRTLLRQGRWMEEAASRLAPAMGAPLQACCGPSGAAAAASASAGLRCYNSWNSSNTVPIQDASKTWKLLHKQGGWPASLGCTYPARHEISP